VKLTLPYPVSVNRYWLTAVNKKTGRAMMFPSKDAKVYKAQIGWIARAAGVRKPIAGAVEFRFRLVPDSRVCMDLDNGLKVVIDALKNIVFGDDSQVYRIVAERGEPDGGEKRVEVEIVPLLLPMALEAAA
jgi:crossover junction endodeoxyribonuclease RusA